MRRTTSRAPLAYAISEAFGEVHTLAEEMREAFSNTPESLQQSRMGQGREAAAVALDLSQPYVPEILRDEKHQVEWREMHEGKERKLLAPPICPDLVSNRDSTRPLATC